MMQLMPSTKNPLIGLVLLSALFLSACGSTGGVAHKSAEARKSENVSTTANPKPSSNTPNLPKANSGRGGYYQDDGPGDDIPPDLESTVDPIPVIEPYSRTGNKPYQVFGKTYTPINDNTTPFKQRGVASWYGKKFHGKRTSSGEPYDMYKITAAHPLLPIPSYARVTNLANGKQIIVRINDRGPFHSSRIMDLSYTAALKLGYLGKGSSEVELERLLPEDIAKMAENRQNQSLEPAPTKAVEKKLASEKTASAESKPSKQSKANEAPIQEQSERISIEALLASQEKNNQIDAATKTQDNATGASFYLQFAAFAIRANAENSMLVLKKSLREKMGAQSVENDLRLEVIQQGNLYRLQSGPYPSRAAASAAADQVALGGAKPIILQR